MTHSIRAFISCNFGLASVATAASIPLSYPWRPRVGAPLAGHHKQAAIICHLLMETCNMPTIMNDIREELETVVEHEGHMRLIYDAGFHACIQKRGLPWDGRLLASLKRTHKSLLQCKQQMDCWPRNIHAWVTAEFTWIYGMVTILAQPTSEFRALLCATVEVDGAPRRIYDDIFLDVLRQQKVKWDERLSSSLRRTHAALRAFKSDTGSWPRKIRAWTTTFFLSCYRGAEGDLTEGPAAGRTSMTLLDWMPTSAAGGKRGRQAASRAHDRCTRSAAVPGAACGTEDQCENAAGGNPVVEGSATPATARAVASTADARDTVGSGDCPALAMGAAAQLEVGAANATPGGHTEPHAEGGCAEATAAARALFSAEFDTPVIGLISGDVLSCSWAPPQAEEFTTARAAVAAAADNAVDAPLLPPEGLGPLGALTAALGPICCPRRPCCNINAAAGLHDGSPAAAVEGLLSPTLHRVSEGSTLQETSLAHGRSANCTNTPTSVYSLSDLFHDYPAPFPAPSNNRHDGGSSNSGARPALLKSVADCATTPRSSSGPADGSSSQRNLPARFTAVAEQRAPEAAESEEERQQKHAVAQAAAEARACYQQGFRLTYTPWLPSHQVSAVMQLLMRVRGALEGADPLAAYDLVAGALSGARACMGAGAQMAAHY